MQQIVSCLVPMYLAKWLRCGASMLALAIAGCAPAPTPAPLDAVAEAYVRAALRLAQHRPELVEDWRGPADWRPQAREPVAQTDARIAEAERLLESAAALAPDSDEGRRRDYLRAQLRALHLAAQRLLGQSVAFDVELEQAFGLRPEDLAAPDASEARAALAARLPGPGSLRDRHEAFRRRFIVPTARRRAVLEAAIAACRRAMPAHLPLPDDEAVDLQLDVESPWDGTARYAGAHRSTIAIADSGPLDVSRAVTLACHEAYPGHHVQFILLDAAREARGWHELELTPRFGRHVLVAEGAAEAGVDLAMPRDARRRLYAETIFPLAGLPVPDVATLLDVEERVRALDILIPGLVGRYLDSRASRDETVERLGEAGVLDPGAFLTFAERRRTLAVVYPIGRRVVMQHLQRGGDPWTRLVALFSERPFALDERSTEK